MKNTKCGRGYAALSRQFWTCKWTSSTLISEFCFVFLNSLPQKKGTFFQLSFLLIDFLSTVLGSSPSYYKALQRTCIAGNLALINFNGYVFVLPGSFEYALDKKLLYFGKSPGYFTFYCQGTTRYLRSNNCVTKEVVKIDQEERAACFRLASSL